MSSPDTRYLEQFLGIIYSVSKKINVPHPPHLAHLIKSHNPPEPKNIEAAIMLAGQSFKDAQCACLFANIVNLCTKNGQVTEKGLISVSQDHLRLEKPDARDMEEAIEIRFQINRIFRTDEELQVLCAGLFAMAQSDQELVDAERAYLQQFITDSKHIEGGMKLGAERGVDIGEKLAAFNNRQKRCFASHAIAMMFIDGQWKGTEQEFMDAVVKRMVMSQFDVKRLMKGLYTLFNVSVFA